MIELHQLIGPGGKEGARELFEKLIRQLVGLRYPGVSRVTANPGDWGIDTFVGELDGVISVWQSKFFIDGVGGGGACGVRCSRSSSQARWW